MDSLSEDYVIGHIESIRQRYSFQRLQIYDDDFFIDLDRMANLLRNTSAGDSTGS
jgi:hypothetical protein